MSAQAMCSCEKVRKLNKGKNTLSIAAKLFLTTATKEGYCIHCNHHVVWKSTYDIYPKSNSSIGGYLTVSKNRKEKWAENDVLNYSNGLLYTVSFESLSGYSRSAAHRILDEETLDTSSKKLPIKTISFNKISKKQIAKYEEEIEKQVISDKKRRK